MKRVLITLVIVLCVTVGPTAALAGNEVPLADAGLDQVVEQGTTVVLDATGSRDPDGTIVAFEWSIETPRGRVITPAETTQPRTTFHATELGLYRVTISVTDENGASVRDTLYVTVNRSDARGPTERSAEPPVDESNTTQNSSDQTNSVIEETTEQTKGSRDDTSELDEDANPPSNTGDQTVEVVTYVAEDIDYSSGVDSHTVNNNKLPGASHSKKVDYTELEYLSNAVNVFEQGVKELIFGRERNVYTFTTTDRSEALYENSPKNDINGYALDVFSDGPAIGLNKEYVDFRRVSSQPIDEADVYRVRVVVQGERGLRYYLTDQEEEDTHISIVDMIHSYIGDYKYDYSNREDNR
jgi:hypothetical protein